MNFSYGLPAALIGTTTVLIQPQVATALTADAVNQIANEITVLIDGQSPGSGVIVARQGNRYYVLTARHVVATEDEYTVVAPDGARYDIDYRTVRKLPDVDLAVLQFTSDRQYKIATLGNYDYSNEFWNVFVSGWFSAGNNAANPVRRFSPGLLISKNFALASAQDPISRGYELFYTNNTDIGMSGGPLLDSSGRVIGIHGRAEGEEIYDKESGEVSRLKLGFSSGVPVRTFLRLAPQAVGSLALQVENSSPPPLTAQETASIAAALKVPEATGNLNALDWANRGNQLYRTEQFAEALAAFDRAIDIKPDFYQAWYGRGQVLSTLGWYEEALASYDQALQIKPDFQSAWRDLGVVLALLRRPEEAAAAFDRAINIQPNDYIAWYLQGNLLKKELQSYEAAIGSYDKAIQIQPNFAEAWTGRGRALFESRQYEAALSSFNQATQINPNLASAWLWRGSLLLDMQRYEEALASFERAIQITPKNHQLWLLKGITLAKLRRYDNAVISARRALELKPNDPQVIDFLNSVTYSPPNPTGIYNRPI
jgi:tetratricopeptide (TPR) repeat protein